MHPPPRVWSLARPAAIAIGTSSTSFCFPTHLSSSPQDLAVDPANASAGAALFLAAVAAALVDGAGNARPLAERLTVWTDALERYALHYREGGRIGDAALHMQLYSAFHDAWCSREALRLQPSRDEWFAMLLAEVLAVCAFGSGPGHQRARPDEYGRALGRVRRAMDFPLRFNRRVDAAELGESIDVAGGVAAAGAPLLICEGARKRVRERIAASRAKLQQFTARADLADPGDFMAAIHDLLSKRAALEQATLAQSRLPAGADDEPARRAAWGVQTAFRDLMNRTRALGGDAAEIARVLRPLRAATAAERVRAVVDAYFPLPGSPRQAMAAANELFNIVYHMDRDTRTERCLGWLIEGY